MVRIAFQSLLVSFLGLGTTFGGVAFAQELQLPKFPQDQVDICMNLDPEKKPAVHENKWSLRLNDEDKTSKADIVRAMIWMQKPGMTASFLPAPKKMDVAHLSFILDYDPDFKDSQGRQNSSAFKDYVLANLLALPRVKIYCVPTRWANPSISISN